MEESNNDYAQVVLEARQALSRQVGAGASQPTQVAYIRNLRIISRRNWKQGEPYEEDRQGSPETRHSARTVRRVERRHGCSRRGAAGQADPAHSFRRVQAG